MRLLRSFLSRSWEDRSTIVRTTGVALLVKLVLASRGYRATVGLLTRFSRAGDEELETKRGRALLAQRVMTRLPVHLTCLERSLVVWWLVGGDPHAGIRFGVQAGEGTATPKFHAWVEFDGEILDDGLEDISTFLPLMSVESVQLGRFD